MTLKVVHVTFNAMTLNARLSLKSRKHPEILINDRIISAKEGAKIFIANKPVVSSCTFAVYLQ